MAAVAAVKFRRLEEDEEEDTEKGDIGNGLAEATKEKVLSESCTIVVEEDAEATLEKERHLLARVKRSIKDKKNSRVCSVINSWKAVVAGLIAFTLAMGISLLIYKLVKEPSPPFHPGGVATDAPVCSDMAGKILEMGGSAVDAAITGLLCVGLVQPESSGIGGGGFMIVFDPTNSSSTAINFRETAPAAASKCMFHGNETMALVGGLSVAIPGEIAGMSIAHKKFGRLKWEQLFEPVINLSREGFNLTYHSAKAVRQMAKYSIITNHSIFRRLYYNDQGDFKNEGDLIRRPEFAEVLEEIAFGGANAFYTGKIAGEIVRAVESFGGILTLEDLQNYEPRIDVPLKATVMDTVIHTLQAPSGGSSLTFSLKVMDYFLREKSIDERRGNSTYQHLVESFKYMFALRSYLGDPFCELCQNISDSVLAVQSNMTSDIFTQLINRSISDLRTFNVSHYNPSYDVPQDSGTTHVSAVDSNGLAVSVTSSVNTYFGSKIMTDRGIVINNDMDDFSSPNITNTYNLPPFTANYIRPGKRGLSSTCPSIFTKTAGERQYAYLTIGGAGGTHISTAVAQAALRVLALNEDIESAIEAKRLHHQLIPNVLLLQDGFPPDIRSYLQSIGHTVVTDTSFAVVQGIVRQANDNTTAHSDSRKNLKPGHAYLLSDNRN